MVKLNTNQGGCTVLLGEMIALIIGGGLLLLVRDLGECVVFMSLPLSMHMAPWERKEMEPVLDSSAYNF